ncbi:hypothetical protein BGZ70_001940 [Mortierella alpina]|uniref:Uncharacterized protein n=1 Tax=Mortierella alpina TaxID=64518 RepID=A0A9P6IUY6_MORAP|nr:hypothetical protein BGZ70_001940 [Mortierella alpina]
MTLVAPAHTQQLPTDRTHEPAPALLEPKRCLGSRTPMHLVHISNLKLNAEIFSSRSLPIHRRILIRNFLTLLYQRHPIEWIEESPVDDKDQWLEQTLSAVGIGQSEDMSEEQDHSYSSSYDDKSDTDVAFKHHRRNRDSDLYDYSSASSVDILGSDTDGSLMELSPAAAAAASAVTQRRKPLTLRSTRVPLPRPVSMELPQSLNSYLSNVFDVDWSVGLPSTEDSLFTAKAASPHPRSSLAQSVVASTLDSTSTSTSSNAPASAAPTAKSSPSSTSSASSSFSAFSSSLASSFARASGRKHASASVGPEPITESNRRHQERTLDSMAKKTGHGDFVSGNGYGKSEFDDSESGVDSLRVQQPPPLPQGRSDNTNSGKRYPSSLNQYPNKPSVPAQHDGTPSNSYTAQELSQSLYIHSHNPSHTDSDPREARSSRSSPTPGSRSPRYLKPDDPKPRRAATPPGRRSPRMPPTDRDPRAVREDADLKSRDPSSSTLQHHNYRYQQESGKEATLTKEATSSVLSYPSAGPSSAATATYPPEKSATAVLGSEDEQPYLATALPVVSSRYPHSSPPPPYTLSLEDSLHSGSSVPSGSSTESLVYPQPMRQAHSPLLVHSAPIPVLTTQPQLGSSAATSQYQQYLERQKMFVRVDDTRSESRSQDGMGLMRLLSKQGSKKKTTVAMISAPLPITAPLETTLSCSPLPPSCQPCFPSAALLPSSSSSSLMMTPQPQPPAQDSLFVKQDLAMNARQPAAKNAVNYFKGTLSSVKSGLSRSSMMPTPPPLVSSASVHATSAAASAPRVTPMPLPIPMPASSATPCGPAASSGLPHQRHHRKTSSLTPVPVTVTFAKIT